MIDEILTKTRFSHPDSYVTENVFRFNAVASNIHVGLNLSGDMMNSEFSYPVRIFDDSSHPLGSSDIPTYIFYFFHVLYLKICHFGLLGN